MFVSSSAHASIGNTGPWVGNLNIGDLPGFDGPRLFLQVSKWDDIRLHSGTLPW